MEDKSTPPKTASDAGREEAFARVRLRHNRARPVYSGMKGFGLVASRLTRSKVKGKGTAINRLRDMWPDIAGEQIAKLCRPEKISASKEGRFLVLKVIPAAAPLIQHQSETLRQRVSVAAGGDLAGIKIVQGQLGDSRRAQPKPAPPPLTPEELAELEASVAHITDSALRAAIVRLGQSVLTQDKTKTDHSKDQ